MSPLKAALRRRGFTLIEILVVLGIIAFLASALTFSLATYLTSAREAQTTATLRKIDGLITERQQALTRYFDSRDFRRKVSDFHEYLKSGDTAEGRIPLYGLAPDFVSVYGKKEMLRESLPQRFAEMTDQRQLPTPGNPKGLGGDSIPDRIQFDEVFQTVTWTPWPASVPPPVGYDVTHPNLTPWPVPFGDTNSNGAYDAGEPLHDPRTESAELLYLALTRFEQLGTPATGVGEFSTAEVADTDNDGLPEFVDGWGNPLRFYRWPTRLVKPFGLLGMDGAYGTAGTDDDGNGSTDVQITDYDEIGYPGSDDTYIHPEMRQFADLYFNGLPRQPVLTEQPPGSGSFRPIPGDFDQLNEDGDDPFGILLDETKRLSRAGIDVFSGVNESKFMTFDTYSKPLVVSVGADGALGLMEPYENEDTFSDPSNGIYPYNGFLDDPSEDRNGNGYLDMGWLGQPINEDFNLDGTQDADLNGNGDFDAFLRPLSALDDMTNRNQRAGG